MRKKERQLSELNFSQTFTSGHLKDIFEACQDSRFCLFCAIMQCIRVLSSLFDCMATILKLPAKTKNWPGRCDFKMSMFSVESGSLYLTEPDKNILCGYK